MTTTAANWHETGRAITRQMEDILSVEMAAAVEVLPIQDVALMTIRIASSISMSCALYIVQAARPDVDREAFYDTICAQIEHLNRSSKAAGFAKLDAELAGRSAS